MTKKLIFVLAFLALILAGCQTESYSYVCQQVKAIDLSEDHAIRIGDTTFKLTKELVPDKLYNRGPVGPAGWFLSSDDQRYLLRDTYTTYPPMTIVSGDEEYRVYFCGFMTGLFDSGVQLAVVTQSQLDNLPAAPADVTVK